MDKLLLLDYLWHECIQVSQLGRGLGRLEVLVLWILLVIWLLLRHLEVLVLLLLLVVWHRLWHLLVWVEVALVEGIGWVRHGDKVLLVLVEPLVVVVPVALLVISVGLAYLLVLRNVLLLHLLPGLLFGCFVGLLFTETHQHVLR